MIIPKVNSLKNEIKKFYNMYYNELMINNRILVSNKNDIFSARVTKISTSGIEVTRYDTSEVLTVLPENCKPYPITLNILANEVGFTKRYATQNEELVLLLELPNSSDFYMIVLGEETNGVRAIRITDTNYNELLVSKISSIHQLQNLVKIATNLELHFLK